MCRAANCAGISLSHMIWRGDAFGVFFSQMKNDQFGDRPKDPRHVYANPIIPHISVPLSLGIYFLCFPVILSGVLLFPGVGQYERFRRILSEVLHYEDVEEELARRGLIPEDIGAHSARKGSGTYVPSGSTACPSSAAIHIRMGWNMPGVGNTYYRYEAAGDQYVGRCVSGLPIPDKNFAILPPRFICHLEHDRKLVNDSIQACFPNSSRNMFPILEFALASVVYHVDMLKENLPSLHPLWNTALFRLDYSVDRLKGMVVCGFISHDGGMQATRIPPHIYMQSEIASLSNAVESVRPHVIEGVVSAIEERALSSNNVTHHGLEVAIQNGFARFESRIEQLISLSVATTSNESSGVIQSNQLYLCGDEIRRTPVDFELPKVNVLSAWQYWCCGDPQKQISPFRFFDSRDMPTRDMRKRLSDFKFLMTILENSARNLGLWKQAMTIEVANSIFNEISSCIELPEKTSNNRRRR